MCVEEREQEKIIVDMKVDPWMAGLSPQFNGGGDPCALPGPCRLPGCQAGGAGTSRPSSPVMDFSNLEHKHWRPTTTT